MYIILYSMFNGRKVIALYFKKTLSIVVDSVTASHNASLSQGKTCFNCIVVYQF